MSDAAEWFIIGLVLGSVAGIEWCIFLKRSAERNRWPYRRRP